MNAYRGKFLYFVYVVWLV